MTTFFFLLPKVRQEGKKVFRLINRVKSQKILSFLAAAEKLLRMKGDSNGLSSSAHARHSPRCLLRAFRRNAQSHRTRNRSPSFRHLAFLGWLALGLSLGVGHTSQSPDASITQPYLGIVERASSGAKGDSWAVALHPFRKVEPDWANQCIANGIGSGEGLIERVADGQTILGKDGKAEVIPGASGSAMLGSAFRTLGLLQVESP